MSDYAKTLLEKRANVWEQAKSLLDHAASEKRELSADEEVSYGKMTADIESLRSRADQLVSDSASADAAEVALRSLMGKPAERTQQADASTGLRSLIRGDVRSMEFAATVQELRALSKGTPTAGGNTVPTSFSSQLLEHLVESSAILTAGATVWNTTSGESFVIPKTTAHGTAALVAEGALIGGTDPAFGNVSLGAFKYGELISVPRELADDTAVDLEGYLARQAGRAVGNALGAHLISGTGGGTQPRGLFLDTTLGATSATLASGVPSFDNLIDLFYSVIAPYRNSPAAGWLIKDSTAGAVRKLKDTSGRYLWESSVTAGTPDMILSKPVYTDPFVAATGLNAKSVAFGDLSAYNVRLVNNIRFERSDEFGFDRDLITFRCLIRGDGALADTTGAVKHLVGAAS